MRKWMNEATLAPAVVAVLSTLLSPLAAYADGGGSTGPGGNGQISFTYRDSYGAPTLAAAHEALAAMELPALNDASHPANVLQDAID